MANMDIAAYGGNSRVAGIGSSFALDLARRVSQSKGLNVSPPEGDAEAAQALQEKTTQLQKLEKSLGGTVKYMADAHGERAASAMMGIAYKRLGDGEITEQTLGDAFLDVTKFIDANFGVSKGDAFMEHLNGSLNDSMNELFDNGLSEKFMAVSSSSKGGGAVAGLMAEVAEQYTESVKAMLEEARKKAHENTDLERSPIAAYAEPWRENALQGVLKDVMV